MAQYNFLLLLNMERFKSQNNEHKTTARTMTTIVCYRLVYKKPEKKQKIELTK